LYPDVEIVTTRQPARPEPMPMGAGAAAAMAITPAPLIVPVWQSVEVRLFTVEIRDVARNELVTSIEMLLY